MHQTRLSIARSSPLPCGVLNKYRVEIEELYYHSTGKDKYLIQELVIKKR